MSAAANRARLDRATITQAAIELLDEAGLNGLSTRRLATKLGVRSPTLYWHVRDKEELLDLIAEAVCADAFDIDPCLPWRERLARGLDQFRALLGSHRDLPELLRQRPPRGPHRLGHLETTINILLEAGLPDADAVTAAQVLAAHVLSSFEPGPRPADSAELSHLPTLQRLTAIYDQRGADERYQLGCELLLDGIARRLERAGT